MSARPYKKTFEEAVGRGAFFVKFLGKIIEDMPMARAWLPPQTLFRAGSIFGGLKPNFCARRELPKPGQKPAIPPFVQTAFIIEPGIQAFRRSKLP